MHSTALSIIVHIALVIIFHQRRQKVVALPSSSTALLSSTCQFPVHSHPSGQFNFSLSSILSPCWNKRRPDRNETSLALPFSEIYVPIKFWANKRSLIFHQVKKKESLIATMDTLAFFNEMIVMTYHICPRRRGWSPVPTRYHSSFVFECIL